MTRRYRARNSALSVSCYDHAERRSVSFTIYARSDEFSTVVDRLHDAAKFAWSVTSLTDRRHKRR